MIKEKNQERKLRGLSFLIPLLSFLPQAAAVANPSLLSRAATEDSLPNKLHAAEAVTEETAAVALAHGGRKRVAPPPPAEAEAAAVGRF